LPDRDAVWSTFIARAYADPAPEPVKNLLEWSELEETQAALEDESVLLAGITLVWFLSSSSRFVRDRSTKALVRLFTPRLKLLCKLIWGFRGVDDLYVLQRLAATAYGCCMRSSDRSGIAALARVCVRVLDAGERIPDILMRDYVRGILERAAYLKLSGLPATESVRPPYRSKWPRKIATEKSLAPLGDYNTVSRAQHAIFGSVMGFGDFARYIIGTNSHSFDWLSLRLDQAPPPSREEVTRAFAASLTGEKRKLWRRLQALYKSKRSPRTFTLEEVVRIFKTEAENFVPEVPGGVEVEVLPPATTKREPPQKKQDSLSAVQSALYRGLTTTQRKVFRTLVLPYLERGERDDWAESYRFDLSLIQRFVSARVFDLGWKGELFNDFDSDRHSYDRGTHKEERIGKKYQWMAYHEALGRIADNFVFAERWDRQIGRYNGPWQISGLRDIDPSIVITRTPRTSQAAHRVCWWAPPPYHGWHVPECHEDWLKSDSDLPSINSILSVTDPADGTKWLTMEAYFQWKEPIPPEMEWGERDNREIGTYSSRTY
jgi:hypothetical protein